MLHTNHNSRTEAAHNMIIDTHQQHFFITVNLLLIHKRLITVPDKFLNPVYTLSASGNSCHIATTTHEGITFRIPFPSLLWVQ